MEYINKTKIHGGHKNETFKITNEQGNFFMKLKKYDNFNHKINYKDVSKFDFVPELFSENSEQLIWEFLESKELVLNKENLVEIAGILYKLHNSTLELPPSNHKARLEEYFNALKDKENIPKEVKTFHQIALDIINGFDTSTPLHNDPWINNFVKTDKRIFLIDWEFASLGDKHFDLAFAIDGSYMNSEQEKIFLEGYGKNNYDSKKLEDAKILVNYLTLVWMHRYDELPFSDEEIIKNLLKHK